MKEYLSEGLAFGSGRCLNLSLVGCDFVIKLVLCVYMYTYVRACMCGERERDILHV